MNAIELIRAVRQRQIDKGWTRAHDDTRMEGELASAAACYALESTGKNYHEQIAVIWPFGRAEFRPGATMIDDLVRAGALIVAEIERLQRVEYDGEDTVQSIFNEIGHEVSRAIAKFPTWPTDPIHATGVLVEEVGELQKEVMQMTYEPSKSSHEAVRKEALQSAAMAVRFLMSLDKYVYSPQPQHSQDASGRTQE